MGWNTIRNLQLVSCYVNMVYLHSFTVLQFYCALLCFTEIWQRSLWFFWESSALRPATSRLQRHTPMPCRVPPGCGNSPQISPTCQLCIPNAACPWKLHKGGVFAMFAGQDFCMNQWMDHGAVVLWKKHEKAIRMQSNAMAAMAPSTERHPDLSVSTNPYFSRSPAAPPVSPGLGGSVASQSGETNTAERSRQCHLTHAASHAPGMCTADGCWWQPMKLRRDRIIQGKSLNLWTFLQQFVAQLILNA